MKHLLNIALGLVFCLGVFTACDNDDDVAISGFSLSKTEVAANPEGGKETVTVSSEGEWVAKSSKPWLNISPANGFGNTECVITIDEALDHKQELENGVRQAEIRFTPKGQSPQVITVTQLGYNKMVFVKEQKVDIKASDVYTKRYFEAVITANVPFDINFEWLTDKPTETQTGEEEADKKMKDWLWVDKKNLPTFETADDRTARPQTYKVRFEWKMNPEWIERQAKIDFSLKSENRQTTEGEELERTPILVTQAASPEITDDRAGDSLAILTIHERLLSDLAINPSENMMYWSNVTLWKRTDNLPKDEDGQPIQEAIGRVRAVNFGTIMTKETLPQEVRYLKYLETFQVYGNANTMLLSIDLDSHICELKHLKHLQIGGYGLVSLPEDFVKLGNTLVSLDISSNNFTSVPAVLTAKNFPKLKALHMNGNRRWTVNNLKNPGDYNKDTDLGFHINMTESPMEIDQLFLWENLEELVLSYNYLEGSLPTYEGKAPWTADDLKQYGDTCNYLLDHQDIPKILPNMKRLQLNLNFFTGKLPNWLLYHPHLLDWFPEVLIFNQQEMGIDSQELPVKFDNTPTNFEYYFKAYPKYREKYELIGEDETIKPEE